MRKPDTPCAGCGKLLWSGKGSLPAGQAKCRDCRRVARISLSVKATSRTRRRTPARRPCRNCGTAFALDPKNSRQAYCSTICVGEASRRSWPSSRVHTARCEECGEAFTARRRNKKMHAECYKARQARRYYDNPKYRNDIIARGHASRADKLGLGNTRITLAYLIERDRGLCRIPMCVFRSRRVAALGTKGPRRPSMDHIVPLSRGGMHELSNVQLGHDRCNRVKNNRGGGDQLRFIG